ncbi:MAG: DUF1294 domain-containing protein [Lachnospiraceae bacterium]|nr:DUF1294 domain-containing protein [Lachnospiraceae bacterium]
MLKYVIAIYLIIINITGFAVMGVDKKRARQQAWRIPEKSLFLVSIIGGSLGTFLGMRCFRHKTKHWYFVIFMPLILILHLALAFWLANYFIWHLF